MRRHLDGRNPEREHEHEDDRDQRNESLDGVGFEVRRFCIGGGVGFSDFFAFVVAQNPADNAQADGTYHTDHQGVDAVVAD